MWETVLSTGGVAIAMLAVTQIIDGAKRKRDYLRSIRMEPLEDIRAVLERGNALPWLMVGAAKDKQIILNDVSSFTVAISKAAVSIHSLDNAEVVGRSLSDCRDALTPIIRRVMADGAPSNEQMNQLQDSMISLNKIYADSRKSTW